MTTITTTRQRYDIPLSALVEDDSNIRSEYSPESIAQLAASIKGDGLLTNLIVRPGEDDTYIIVAGHRRYRALLLLAKSGDLSVDDTIPCDLQGDSVGDAIVTMLVENLQREDIAPMDEAHGYLRLTTEFGYKPKELSAAIGQSIAHINARLALVILPDDMKAVIGKSVSLEQAGKIARIEDPKKRASLAKQAVKGTLTSYGPDHALREQEEAKAKAKILTWGERNLVTIHTTIADSPVAKDRMGWNNALTMTPAELAKYKVQKGDVLVLNYTGTVVHVYRKLTKAELAERTNKTAKPAPAASSDLPERTPLDDWEDLFDAHEAKLLEYTDALDQVLVSLVMGLPAKTIGKIILEQQIACVMNNGYMSFRNPFALLDLLNQSAEDNTPDGTLRDYVDGSSDKALRVAVLGNWLTKAASPTLSEQLTAAAHSAGLVDPGSFDVPEPWLDDNDVWHLDGHPDDVDSGEASEADPAEAAEAAQAA